LPRAVPRAEPAWAFEFDKRPLWAAQIAPDTETGGIYGNPEGQLSLAQRLF